jgi:hypothetical protein
MKKYNCILILLLLALGCSKEYVETDPLTGKEVQALTTDPAASCQLTQLRQISAKIAFNRLDYQRDNANKIQGMNYYDSITNTVDYKLTFQYRGDTIAMGSWEWMIQDGISKNINQYFVRDTTNGSFWDDILYEYKYDPAGKLIKKLTYYNYSSDPDYITNYLYDGNDLITSQLFSSDGKSKLMQTDVSYDASKTIKPWIYLFGDAFENYRYLQGFSFGKRPTHAVKKIVSTIYDVNDGTVLDVWTTNMGEYVISKDQYVLQVTSSGDIQQGMGLLLGTIRFDYQCK